MYSEAFLTCEVVRGQVQKQRKQINMIDFTEKLSLKIKLEILLTTCAMGSVVRNMRRKIMDRVLYQDRDNWISTTTRFNLLIDKKWNSHKNEWEIHFINKHNLVLLLKPNQRTTFDFMLNTSWFETRQI